MSSSSGLRFKERSSLPIWSDSILPSPSLSNKAKASLYSARKYLRKISNCKCCCEQHYWYSELYTNRPSPLELVGTSRRLEESVEARLWCARVTLSVWPKAKWSHLFRLGNPGITDSALTGRGRRGARQWLLSYHGSGW